MKGQMDDCCDSAPLTESTEAFFEVVERRRSVRKYRRSRMPADHLDRILKAAQLAPSARNAQPWSFIVVSEDSMKRFLAKAVGNQTFVGDASVVVAVLGSRDQAPYWYMYDPMIAAEHIVLAATALGYGTCWIGALADYVPENAAAVKKALKIPEDRSIVCLLTIGVPDENPPARPRDRLETMCFKEVFGNPMKFR